MMSRLLRSAPFALLLSSTGCSEETINPVDKPSTNYQATIRRTSYGIPHILADDYPSAAFALAYASAPDTVCILSDQVTEVRSERSKTFGPGEDDANVENDFAMKALRVYSNAERGLPLLSQEARDALLAYAAGFNHYLEEVGGAGLPELCRNAEWVKPVTATDLLAHYLSLSLLASAQPFLGYVTNAQPPGAMPTSGKAPQSFPDLRQLPIGSNGWAIGKDRSAGGKGMLLANPHFPWEGELRFYESHITVPGEVDVYGGSLTGVPVINIGFNEHVGWTHTVTPASHFAVYKLSLAADDPMTYLYDGSPRPITSEELSIEVKLPDGTSETRSRFFHRSHLGPMVVGPGLTWSATNAFAFRDANDDNLALVEQWFAMNRAKSVEEIATAQERLQGIPWVFTMTADDQGNAMLLDGSRVPRLSPEGEAAFRNALATDGLTGALYQNGAILLDGSSSLYDWVDDGGAGLWPVAEAPRVARSDFALNANDPPWMANPDAVVEPYSIFYGSYREPLSPRTRMNLKTLSEQGASGASGADSLFSFDELRAAALSNRSIMAELLLTELVGRTQAAGVVDIDGTPVDVSAASAVLAGYSGRLDADARGAALMREFLGQFAGETSDAGKLFAVPFDPADPLGTPRILAPAPQGEPDPMVIALGRAVLALGSAGIAIDAPLGEVQFTRKAGEVIRITGGSEIEGVTNIAQFRKLDTTLLPGLERAPLITPATGLTSEGYLTNFGTSFIMVLEFTASGPHAEALLTSGQSPQPESPHHSDQTKLFSQKQFRPILFREADILADPELEVIMLDVPRKP